MGNVAITFKIMVEPGKEEEVKNEISKIGAKDIRIEDIGFGIKVIKALFVSKDEEGTSTRIEEQIRNIKGVNEVNAIDETLI